MPPDRSVEPADVSDHRRLGLAAGLPGGWPDQLGLDGLEERLNHSVIVAVVPHNAKRAAEQVSLEVCPQSIVFMQKP